MKVELTKRKLGVRISGNCDEFRTIYDYLSECWCDDDYDTSPVLQVSYVGILGAFAYDLRHTFMGDRVVKLDGKKINAWSNRIAQLFEDEKDRFEVGLELSWPEILFILASYWQCHKVKDCPLELTEKMRFFQTETESLLKVASGKYFTLLEPYLHGAIYIGNPCLIQTMSHVILEYLSIGKFTKGSFADLAKLMSVSLYQSSAYSDFMGILKRAARKEKCEVYDISVDFGNRLENVEL